MADKVCDIQVVGYSGKPGAMHPVYRVCKGKVRYRRDAEGVWLKERDGLKGARRNYQGYVGRNYVRVTQAGQITALEALITQRKQAGIDDSYKGE